MKSLGDFDEKVTLMVQCWFKAHGKLYKLLTQLSHTKGNMKRNTGKLTKVLYTLLLLKPADMLNQDHVAEEL